MTLCFSLFEDYFAYRTGFAVIHLYDVAAAGKPGNVKFIFEQSLASIEITFRENGTAEYIIDAERSLTEAFIRTIIDLQSFEFCDSNSEFLIGTNFLKDRRRLIEYERPASVAI